MTGFTYKTYSFTDKDPMIDIVRTVVQENGATLKKIAEDSGVNAQTISRWLYGDTKRPQAASVNAVLRACGYKLEVVNYSFKSVVKPTFLTKAPVFQLSRKHKA